VKSMCCSFFDPGASAWSLRSFFPPLCSLHTSRHFCTAGFLWSFPFFCPFLPYVGSQLNLSCTLRRVLVGLVVFVPHSAWHSHCVVLAIHVLRPILPPSAQARFSYPCFQGLLYPGPLPRIERPHAYGTACRLLPSGS